MEVCLQSVICPISCLSSLNSIFISYTICQRLTLHRRYVPVVEVREAVVGSDDVQFYWSQLSSDLDDDGSHQLLRMIVDL